MSRIISYRGKLADGAQDTIPLHTNDGKTGYKVVKFQVIPFKAVTSANESVIQVWKIKQTALTSNIDFGDLTLLAVGVYSNQSDTTYYPDDMNIVFDNEIFNQDIYLTHVNETGSGACNYYLELEQIDLTEDQALVAIVKNLRNEQ